MARFTSRASVATRRPAPAEDARPVARSSSCPGRRWGRSWPPRRPAAGSRRGTGPACGIAATGWRGSGGKPARRPARPAAARGRDTFGQHLFGERQHLRKGMRRFDFADAESGQRPGAVLVAQQAQPERLLPRCTGDDHPLPNRPLGQPELMRRIADAHIDGLFRWALISPLLQPDRQPGAASGRVDDQVGGT